MSSRHLVDPELIPSLDESPPLMLTLETLPQMRLGFAEMMLQMARSLPIAPGVEFSERRVPGLAGAPEVRVLVYRPTAVAPAGGWPAMLHIHGGGYVIGSPELNDVSNRRLVREVGCVIVSVDYRLAPETPFPGPVEDCYAALEWLHANASALGVDTRRLAIGGESAGGGLAAALALLARDRGEIPILFQSLVFPMLDDRTASGIEPAPHLGEFIWTRESNRLGWRALLGHAPGGAGVSPYAAPARVESVAGLPPTFIAVGALDLFLDEDVEYARRLLQAGIPTELHVYPGAYHGFMLSGPQAQVTQAFQRDYEQALRRALHPASSGAERSA
ncbi:alpha/beta hydrolase [Melittangium boletus]|uniref:Esterase n=1 Tax=Melittangium boletus DSM 14713 TaxID=1294270 RepID=A0A250IKE2_9BACT|nr:alpha/beta hydrolase [Melittangium boletus]ATB31692.1 esterase [Melittangium boletus DSM 14713]